MGGGGGMMCHWVESINTGTFLQINKYFVSLHGIGEKLKFKILAKGALLTEHHVMEAYWGMELAPLILWPRQ
jgi:hypothetical protein